MEIKRDYYLNKLINKRNNGLIKVITGIRRCGKSYILDPIFKNYLLEQGVKEDHIIKLELDSVENEEYLNPRALYDYVMSKIKDDATYYIILDEIQKVENFESVLNSFLRKPNLDVYVTGSNSKFLSKDVLTEFAGRGDEIHVFPLSFSEFYSFSNGNLDYAFDEYMTYGGLPAIALMKTEEQKVNYLKTQIKNVYLKDIVERNHLFSDENIEALLSVIASGIASLTNPSKLANTFKSVKKSTISANTINSYINYMQDAFILSKVNRYDLKGKKYINSPYKIYFEDVGLRNAQLDFRQIENTHLMENVIYNELRYRGYHVDVGVVNTKENKDGIFKRKQLEIDFVANLGSKRYYIQSAYDIPDEEKMQQETKSFDKTRDSFKKIVIVEKSMKPRRTEKGYLMLGIKEFLLNPNSLEL